MNKSFEFNNPNTTPTPITFSSSVAPATSTPAPAFNFLQLPANNQFTANNQFSLNVGAPPTFPATTFNFGVLPNQTNNAPTPATATASPFINNATSTGLPSAPKTEEAGKKAAESNSSIMPQLSVPVPSLQPPTTTTNFGGPSVQTNKTEEPGKKAAESIVLNTLGPLAATNLTTTPTLPKADEAGKKATDSSAPTNIAFPISNNPIVPTQANKSLTFEEDSVETIIKKWKSDLSDDIKNFKEQAKRVSDWESQLHENSKNAQQLYLNITKVELYYDEISTGCEEINSWQDELDKELTEIENLLKKYVDHVEDHDEEIGENDIEREEILHEGENLDKYLQDMESKLEKIMKDFTLARGEGGKEDSNNNPIAGIMQILNSHHNNLAWLDSKTKLLYAEINALRELNN